MADVYLASCWEQWPVLVSIYLAPWYKTVANTGQYISRFTLGTVAKLADIYLAPL